MYVCDYCLHTQSESLMNLLNEGSSSPDQPSEGKSASSVGSQQSGSQDPLVQSGTGMVAEQVRSKDLSQVNGPTLEVADNVASDSLETREEEEGGYASVTKSDAREYDHVDKTGGVVEDDEAGYAYATVGGAMGGAIGEGPVQPVAEPDGDDKIADKENAQDGEDRGSGLPPYGKVIRHMVPIAKRSDYSEVVSASPLLPPGRPRAVTEPIDPTSSPSMEQHHHCMRDDRAFTESAAHLPLPQIPRLNVNDEMYDSIPDQLRNDATSGATSGGAEKPVRESLYESVEATGVEGDKQADEDMYESVPEDMRQNAPPTPSSPDTLSPSSPFPPPPRSPVNVRTGLKAEGVPASPSLKEREEEDGRKRGKEHVAKDSKNEQKKHKMLSKAKSDSEPRGRSLSSFFNRKKGSSGNAPVSPKLKQLKEPPILPFITASTSSISSPTHHFQPSPPPIPAPPPPDEDEEDYPPDGAYDMIDVLNPRGAAFLAKSRSASLPSAMRNAGGSPFHSYDHGPLPQLPEESAGGLVARQRVKEDMDPEYDTVVLGQVQDDPNYDSVEVSHENEAMPKLELAEPPTGNDGQPKEALTPANKYAKVSSHMAVEGAVSPDHTAVSPEHDELGYAVIPAHLKMKKRAMSDAMKKKKAANEKSTAARPKSAELVEDTFYHTLQDEMETADATGLSLSPPMEPEYESVTDALREAENIAGEKETPYATVDMAAKRRSQFLKQQSGGAGLPLDDFRDNSPSPNPPPLPQQGDLGDLAEFEQPPIPIQAEASLQLIEPSELQRPSAHKIINPYSQIDTLSDPPYASVKKKQLPETTDNAGVAEQNQPDDNYEDENPYATVDNESESIETVSTGASDPPYAKIKRGRVVEDESDPGYEKTGMKVELHDGEAIVKTSQNGATYHDNGEDDDDGTYDRLDHGFGNSATCRANAAVLNHAASDNRECTTVTVDFSSSPELVVTEPGIVDTEINGVVTHTEEKIINFTT